MMPQRNDRRIALQTLGCKANWADGEGVAQALRAAGFVLVPPGEAAEAVIVNTCAVTAAAVQQSRQALRRARRNGAALVVATGCCGELDREALQDATGADAVFGTRDRAALVASLRARLGGEDCAAPAPDPFGCPPLGPQSRARAFLKIQEGCARRCAYCIIPTVRGAPSSMNPAAVGEACRTLSHFHREVILTGIDIGQYGDDRDDGVNLAALLARLLREEGARLRLSSLDPTRIDDRLVDLWTSTRLCRHIHLSIQSGSSAVLAAMGRGSDAEAVARAVEKIAAAVPGIAVTGDLIAGFPGEGLREHEETVRLIRALPLAGLHVFPYSRRPGTRAASLPNAMSVAERKRRAAELRAIAAEKRRTFLAAKVGECLDVIVTADGAEGAKGFSDNAVVVSLPGGVVPMAERAIARITTVSERGVSGVWETDGMTNSSSSAASGRSATASSGANTCSAR